MAISGLANQRKLFKEPAISLSAYFTGCPDTFPHCCVCREAVMVKVSWGALGALLPFFVLLPIGCAVLVTGAANEGTNLTATFEKVAKDTKTKATNKSAGCVAPNACSPADRLAQAQLAGNAWYYRDDKDEMHGTNSHLAALISQNRLQFAFPFSGGSYGILLVDQRTGHLSVLLRIEKGQFTCDNIGGGAIAVEFDDGSVRNYTCRTPSDGTTNVISIQPSRRFVEALKRSHRAIIEAEFFTEGEQQLAFNTTGLKW
jgi:hypothetical protein